MKKLFHNVLLLLLYGGAAAIFFGFGSLMARGAWWIPSAPTPPNSNVVMPLNTGTLGQLKDGALSINTSQTFPAGLFVYGNPVASGCPIGSGVGCVGIGTSNPTEKLDVVGDIKISGIPGNSEIRGIIKPNGSEGREDQALTVTGPNAMDWVYENAWMTIQRIDVNDGGVCESIFPECPTGWIEHGTAGNPSCNSGGNWRYVDAVRVCYKQLP